MIAGRFFTTFAGVKSHIDSMKTLRLLLFAALTVCGLAACAAADGNASVKVMSYNVRYDNAGDGDNSWTARRDSVAAEILASGADIVGTQEVLHHQFTDLKRILPGFDVVGCGRDDGYQAGEYEALWFKKDRFLCLNSGNFWLSQTPEIMGSLGWDGACVRMASWALLQDKTTGRQLLALNTHLDHVGNEARRRGVELILDRLTAIAPGLPAVVTGDFNSGPGSDPVRYITDPQKTFHLIDSRTVAQKVDGPAWTFHNFGRQPIDQREIIDFIFVTPGVGVASYEILDNTARAPLTPSDHCPVVATIIF